MTVVDKLVIGKMLINGEWVESSDQKVIEVTNMYDMKLVGTVPAGTTEDAQKALDAAQEGAKIWAATPAYKRIEILKAYAEKIKENHEELAQLLSSENGKIIARARDEVNAASRLIEGYADESRRLFGQTIPLEIQEGLEKDIMMTKYEPLGVILGIVPFNFPVELYAHKVGAALASGNAIIVKPPEDDSLSIVRLAEISQEVGIPAGVLQVVTGYGEVVGDYLVKSPQVNGISFTGSSKVGKSISSRAGENLTRVFLELSGNDAVIICEDTDIDMAIDDAVAGRLATNGQVCIATKRILVQESKYEYFKEKLKGIIANKKYGESF